MSYPFLEDKVRFTSKRNYTTKELTITGHLELHANITIGADQVDQFKDPKELEAYLRTTVIQQLGQELKHLVGEP